MHSFGSAKLRVCSRCKNTVEPLAPFKPVAPFWSRLPDILRFPLRDGQWVRLLSWMFAVVVLRGAGEVGLRSGPMGFVFGLPLFVAYYGMLTTYFFRVIDRAEDGDFDVPYWPDFNGLNFSMAWPIVQFGVVLVASFWPWSLIVLGILMASGGNVEAAVQVLESWPLITLQSVALSLSFCLIPMSLLILGVTKSLRRSMNPVFVIRHIAKIPKSYFLATGILFLMLAGYSLVILLIWGLVAISPIQLYLVLLIGMYPIDGLVQVYFLMIAGHLLGYMAYQERFELAWWSKYADPLVLDIDGKRVRMGPALFESPEI